MSSALEKKQAATQLSGSSQVNEGPCQPCSHWRSESGGDVWLVCRAALTENVYKIYAETFKNQSHLKVIISEAQEIVGNALGQS